MYKRIIVGVLILLTAGLLFANSYLGLEYNLNLFEYFTTSSILTAKDRTYIEEHKTLIYGADQFSPPLRYVNHETGQYEGLSIDYFNALSLELGLNIEFTPMEWSEALDKLERGETDLCEIYKSEERAKKFLFTDPIFYQRGAILVKEQDPQIQRPSDLDGKVIASKKGDLAMEYIDENLPQAVPYETPDWQESIEMLVNGQVDVVLGDESVLHYMIKEYYPDEGFVILDEYLYELEVVIGVHKDNQDLRDILNKGIANLNRKKTVDKLYQKWFDTPPLFIKDVENQKSALYIRYGLLLIATLAFFMYYWNKRLKQEVIKRTNELFLSNNELQTILNGLTHHMIVVNEDCLVTDANTAFCKSIGMSEDELRNTHCFKINGILGADCDTCLIKRSLLENAPMVQEIKHQSRHYKVNTFLLEQLPNTKKRILVMMEDVTDAKIGESQLRQAGKMAAIGQLAAGVAHEIRNPNGIIRNTCFLLKTSLDDPEDLESIELIESSVARSNKIIDNLLNFSRITDNTLTKTPIHRFISGILALNSKTLHSKHISYDLDCDADLTAPIYTESLKHVLINLISNAVDAMTDGGHLAISAKEKSEHLVLKVSDTGTGMDEETLQNIFNPFFTTKDPGTGTGLGLYITYNEIMNMQASLDIDSTPGVGTTFIITLPLLEGIRQEDRHEHI